jgi:glycosyltransferase involved in cell wall biosynthesis
MISEGVFISICIPAYKRRDNLKRLLYSIFIQKFKDFEVVISDDSPDDTVKDVVNEFKGIPINYYKNEKALGTPANWNFAISKASGQWIKIMHDDDWFIDEHSLSTFANAVKSTPGKFIFSGYYDVFESGEKRLALFPQGWKNRLIRNPVTLLAKNVIGPPSVILVHRSIKEKYDERMKWRVDIDFYIRLLLAQKDFQQITEPLIYVGIGSTQVTKSCLNNPSVELPEGWLLLKKYGVKRLKDIRLYDAWWRIIRNTNIRSRDQLATYVEEGEWPAAIKRMADFQSLIPVTILKTGVFSKIFMTLSYLINLRNFK